MAFRFGFDTKQVLFGYLVLDPNENIQLYVSPIRRTFRYIHPNVPVNPLIYPLENYLKVGNIISLANLNALLQLQVPNGAYLVTGPVIAYQNPPDLYANLRVVFVVNSNHNAQVRTTDAPINNIYPRYHRDVDEVINCMKVYSTLQYNPEDNYEERDLFRVLQHQKGYLTWWIYPRRFVNFKQLKSSECIEELNIISNHIRYNFHLNIDYSCVGIYVPQNTSLVMMDMFQNFRNPGHHRDHERTLFQEGSVIILENIELRFYFERFNPKEEPQKSTELGVHYWNPFYVLEPVINRLQGHASLTLWCLRITGKIENNRHIAVLVVPEGGAFSRVYDWDQGVNEVIGRKIGAHIHPQPWDKYLIVPGEGVLETLGTDPYPDFKDAAIIDDDWAQPL